MSPQNFGGRKMKCWGSSETRFPKVWGRSEPSSGDKWPFKVFQKLNFLDAFGIEKWNVGDRLKRVFPKFEAKRSHPQGVNSRSKLSKNLIFANVFGVEKWNVGDRLKRVFPKFEAERSHVWGVKPFKVLFIFLTPNFWQQLFFVSR